MSTDLHAAVGRASVTIQTGPDSPSGWSVVLRVAVPTIVELGPTAITWLGDDAQLVFGVSDALLGKAYELVLIEADGDHRSLANGTIVAGLEPLVLDLPSEGDAPRITVSDTAPENPDVDDLWVAPAPTFFVGSTPPETPNVNDIWFDTSAA